MQTQKSTQAERSQKRGHRELKRPLGLDAALCVRDFWFNFADLVSCFLPLTAYNEGNNLRRSDPSLAPANWGNLGNNNWGQGGDHQLRGIVSFTSWPYLSSFILRWLEKSAGPCLVLQISTLRWVWICVLLPTLCIRVEIHVFTGWGTKFLRGNSRKLIMGVKTVFLYVHCKVNIPLTNH